MNSYSEWIAAIPAELTAREALVFIDTALRDADEATRAIVAEFKGGTLPPPPWPQHDALVQVIRALEGGRTFLTGVVNAGRGDVKQPRDGDIGKRLQIAGQTLYREIAVMQRQSAEAKTTAPKMALRLGLGLLDTEIGGLFVLGGLLYLAHKYGDR